jgi:hypothetical protein
VDPRSGSMSHMGTWRGIFVVGALVLTACSGDDEPTSTAAPGTEAPATDAPSDTGGATPVETDPPATDPPSTDPPATDPPVTEPPRQEADPETVAAIEAALSGAPDGCDPLDTRHCLLPFPSNAYRADGRVALPAEGMPVNADGVGIDPTEWNRNDGFSPNTPILTYVEGLDAEATDLPTWTDLEASLADDATVVLVDLDTGERIALWAELDAKADDDADRLLEIHPAIALAEGHTFAVGLRGLVSTAGYFVEPTDTFRAYRDGLVTEIDAIESRRDEMEAAFVGLADHGVDRSELQLAWTFTTATAENIAGRMLHIRDDALADLGDAAPTFTIESITPNTHDDIALQVVGTFTVPNYLTNDGGPGNRFFYGDLPVATGDETPMRNGTLEAPFVCNVSVATAQGTEPAKIVQYGHGLLGSHFEINAGNVRAFANEDNVVFCATKWAGMSEDDIGNAVASLEEFSNFPTMADRLQQGVLNQIFLGRLMLHPDGIASMPEFQRADGSPMLDLSELYYDGNSQGGIMGLMLAAVSPDFERAVLGVTGMNYSLLLSRSVDFETYEAIMEPAYPNDLDRVLIIAVVQMLWDRGEGAGYVQHVTSDPYPSTPAKTLLLHVGFGDWQVSELSAMVEARTIGATIHRPVTAPGRSGQVEPGWSLESTVYPSTGSALVIWDSGSDPIPFENIPPSTSRDSHEDPRADPDVRDQKAAFLFDGELIDVCGGEACTADPRD